MSDVTSWYQYNMLFHHHDHRLFQSHQTMNSKFKPLKITQSRFKQAHKNNTSEGNTMGTAFNNSRYVNILMRKM